MDGFRDGHEITMLPRDSVWNPPPGPFDSSVLTWTGPNHNIAWIPYGRLEDFVEGENRRENYTTNFTIRNSQKIICPTTGVLKKTRRRWACIYGPNDLRGQEATTIPRGRRDDGRSFLRCTTLTGHSQSRGCRCAFSVTGLSTLPDRLQIKWSVRDHVDLQGQICHGTLDPTAPSVKADVARKMSKKMRLHIERLLNLKVSTRDILNFHMDEVITKYRKDHPDEDAGGCRWSRDMQLTAKDISNIREAMRRRTPEYSKDDAVNVKIWVEKNQDLVHVYQPKAKEAD